MNDTHDNTKPLPRDGSPQLGAPTPEDCARRWLAHVEAGRFCRPTATLHEAGGGSPYSPEERAELALKVVRRA